MSLDNPTKKDIKNALKFMTNAPGIACPTCKKELTEALQQMGKAWYDGVNATFTFQIMDGHFICSTPADQHNILPDISDMPEHIDREKIRRAARRERKKAAAAAKAAGLEDADTTGCVAEEESEEDSE